MDSFSSGWWCNRNRFIKMVIWGVFGILALLFTLMYMNFAPDDAYITYRYARNIALGRGFVYNPGEWVLGTTTPLYTVVLALGTAISGLDVPVISTIICSTSLWLCAGFLFEIGESKDRLIAVSIGLIFLTNPFLHLIWGMESLLLVSLLVITCWAYGHGYRRLTVVLNGLLILVRLEMILFTAVIVILEVIRTKKIPTWLFLSLLPLCVWGFYSCVVFGSPIPLSASAKLLAPKIPFLLGFVVIWYRIISENPLLSTTLVFLVAGIVSVLFTREIDLPYWPLILMTLLYLSVAAFFAGSFPWYYAPLLPGLSVIVVMGVKLIANYENNWFRGKSLVGFKSLYKFLYVICLVLIVLSQIVYWPISYEELNKQHSEFRYATYSQASRWLLDNNYNDKTIAVEEIGHIGYLTDMVIIDLYGLVTPGLYEWVEEGTNETLRNSIILYSPDLILIDSNKKSLVEIVQQSTIYEEITRFPNQFSLYQKRNEG